MSEPRTCKLCGGNIGQDRWRNGLMCYGCGPTEALPAEERQKLSLAEWYRRNHDGQDHPILDLLKRKP